MIFTWLGLAIALIACALSFFLCALTRRIAPRFGLVDRPGGRKAHQRPTPMGGGVAIWLTVALVLGAGAALLYLGPSWLPAPLRPHVGGLRDRHNQLAGLMTLSTLIMLMGLADDRFALGWKPRLLTQFVLALVFVLAFGSRITLFLPPGLPSRIVADLVTVFWIVGLTNAFNFLDNMDGLAASVGLIAAALFACAQVTVGGLFVPTVLMVLVGALTGFLIHNWNPARLFMGDAGSNFLGFFLGALTVAGTFTRPYEGKSSPYSVFTPLLVMAVPLYDMISVIWIRLREGRSPFQPDRRHFSHRLVQRGLAPPKAVATIALVTLAGGLGALLLTQVDAVGAAVVLAQTLCLLGIVAVLEASGGSTNATATTTDAEPLVAPPLTSSTPIAEPADDAATIPAASTDRGADTPSTLARGQ